MQFWFGFYRFYELRLNVEIEPFVGGFCLNPCGLLTMPSLVAVVVARLGKYYNVLKRGCQAKKCKVCCKFLMMKRIFFLKRAQKKPVDGVGRRAGVYVYFVGGLLVFKTF